jgi:hypothetical protein
MEKITNIKLKTKEKSRLILEEFTDNITNLGKTEITKSEPAKFVSEIFKSRDVAHIYHLKAQNDGSLAAHLALDDYYKEIVELQDELVETYQGQYNIIENYEMIDSSNTNTQDRIQYFIGLAEFIKNTRYTAFLKEDTHLHNIIDEIVSLVYKTLYKLKNLK